MTTLWADKDAHKASIDELYEKYKGMKIDKVVGAESRGYVIGGALAYLLGAGFVLVRKPGKLPSRSISESYDLEYGSNTIEIHEDAISKGERVLIIDDLLATGGTVNAMINLVNKLGGEVVSCAFIVELTFLNGKDKIKYPIFSLTKY